MYGAGRRHGLGMYGASSRFGLGDASGSGVDVTDLASVLDALGLHWTPDVFGFTNWADAVTYIQSTGGIHQTASFGPMYIAPSGAGITGLVAVVEPWLLFRQPINGYTPTAEQVTTALGITGTWNNPGPRPASVPVSDVSWKQYAAGVLSFAPQLEAIFDATAPGKVAPPPASTAPLTKQQAWNAALAQGVFNAPLQNGGTYAIPLSAILEGPTALPDGNHLVVYQGDPASPNATDILLWHDSSWTKAQALSINVRANSCIPIAPGTGDWYLSAAVNNGAADPACSGVPTGWNQGFGLVGPAAKALLQGQRVLPFLPADQPKTAPAANLVQPPASQIPAPLYVAPAQVGPADANDSAPQIQLSPVAIAPATVPASAAVTPLYQAAATVQPSADVTPAPVTPTPAAAPAAAGTDWLALAGVGLGIAGLVMASRKARRR